MQFSDSAQVRILVGTVAPFWLRLETGSQTSEGTIPSLSNISQTEEPTLLELYLKEHAERMISLPKFSAIDAEREAANERRKSLAEFIVHPVLLVSGTEEHPDEPSETVAVAVNMDSGSIDAQTNGIELAEDLVQEITRYRNIEKISILLVSSEATAKEGCPRELKNLPSSVPVDCIHIDPNWGNEKNGHIEKLLPADGFDVSIVLSGCDVSDPKDRIWEKELYAFTDSVVSTCTGPRRTRPLNSLGVSVKSLRVWTIDALFLEIESGEDAHPYSKIIDYDFQGLNMAVAFHNNMNKVFYKWHCNEANYNNELSSRLKPGSREDLHHFEGADMLRIQFPSKYSANSFCDYLEEYGELDEDEEYQCSSGYDPDSINIPIDQIYVRQSTSGENAGRGVFTSVDLLEAGTMIGMETNIHSVYYPPLCKAIVEGIVDLTVYESFEDENDDDDDEEEEWDEEHAIIEGDSVLMTSGLHRAPSTYAEAYGFTDEYWGSPHISVYSNILTFTNHGCNGTANIGLNIPGVNEFTMDTSNPDFEIPDMLLSFSVGEYSPHRDRKYSGTVTTSQVEHPPILKGQELFDNYISFGGDEEFAEQVNELKQECSGALGTVEKHQRLLSKEKANNGDSKADPVQQQRRRSSDEL